MQYWLKLHNTQLPTCADDNTIDAATRTQRPGSHSNCSERHSCEAAESETSSNRRPPADEEGHRPPVDGRTVWPPLNHDPGVRKSPESCSHQRHIHIIIKLGQNWPRHKMTAGSYLRFYTDAAHLVTWSTDKWCCRLGKFCRATASTVVHCTRRGRLDTDQVYGSRTQIPSVSISPGQFTDPWHVAGLVASLCICDGQWTE